MRRPIAALLSSLVVLISQSAGATNYHVCNKFAALCQFNTLERCNHHMLVSSDLAYADADGDQSTDGAAPPTLKPHKTKINWQEADHCTSFARRQARSNTRLRNLHPERKNKF